MFSEKFQAIVTAPTGKLKDRKGRSTRTIQFKLKTDFTDAIASGLDKGGKAMLRELASRSASKVEIPIDTIGANIKLRANKESITIKGAHGLKIVGKSSGDSDAAPSCEIIWRIDYEEDAWVFLGKNFGATADVTLTNQQIVLPHTEGGGEDEGDKGGDEKPVPKGKNGGMEVEGRA